MGNTPNLSGFGSDTPAVSTANDAPTIEIKTTGGAYSGSASGLVYEAGLAMGSGEGETTKEVTGSFKLADEDGLSDLSHVMVGTSVFTMADIQASTVLLPLMVADTAAGKLFVTGYNAGEVSYKYVLDTATADNKAAGGADIADIDSFKIKVSDDGVTYSAPASLNITITDDVPVNLGLATVTVNEGQTTGGKSDVVLIVDNSGSMAGSRMTALHNAVTELFNSGKVHSVFLVSFAEGVSVHNAGAWYTDLSAALTAVKSLTGDGGATDYDAALRGVTMGFTPPPAGGNALISMFLSDGGPNRNDGTGSDGIDQDDTGVGGIGEEQAWINFLTTNGFDKSLAFGFGGLDNANKAFLEPIAWAPGETADSPYDADVTDATAANAPGKDANVIVVANASDLGAALVAAIPLPPTGGNIITEGVVANPFGADGGHIHAITVNGTTYTWNGVAGSGSVITETGTITGTLTGVSSITDINTGAVGGKLTFYFTDVAGHSAGDYSYVSPVNVNADVHDTFAYVLIDNDGDKTTSTLDILVNNLDAPVAVDDIVITNQLSASISVPSSVLVANDTDLDSDALTATPTSFATGWGVKGADFTATSVRSITFKGEDDTDLTVDRSQFSTAGQAVNAAKVVINGNLDKTNRSDYFDVITVNLKAGETLTLDHDQGAGQVTMAYRAANAVDYTSIANGGSFTAAVAGSYEIRLENIDDNGNDHGGTGEENYDLTMTVNYANTTASTADATGTYTVTDGSQSDTASVSLHYQAGSTLTGTAADEILLGGGNADTLIGGGGHDILIGGAGHDTMTGGLLGALPDSTTDVFKWSLGDQGTASEPAADVVKDFNFAKVANGGDVLDLKDLLTGEHSGAGENLSQYLHFTEVAGKAVLAVDHDAGNGTPSIAPDQTITFDNMSLAQLQTGLGLGGSATDADIIAKMVANGNLKTDL